MFQNKQLFENVNQCKSCKRPLPKKYEQDLCPRCQEIQLFHDVKEYIRSNDVNEYEVADHFHIPLRQVKAWIREGRIEYKEIFAQNSIEGIHCQRCGAPVSFGALCPKCLKLYNGNKGYDVSRSDANKNDNKMRYIDK